MPLSDYLYVLPQYVLPHHALSRLMLKATRIQTRWWKNLLIDGVRRRYAISLADAQEQDPHAYASFNHFFTRALRPDARPPADDSQALISPVDGRVSQAGHIEHEQVFQAKGHSYTLTELLGGDHEAVKQFQNGRFATLYLSPRDYHRIHMPIAGTLRRTIYVPGRLFSVAPHTVRRVPRLFARNERLICLFDTAAGPMAMISVGALFVACIETVWGGVVTPPHGHRIRAQDFDTRGDESVVLARGAEMGRFNMGSTVILLFGDRQVAWAENLVAEQPVRMGQAIGQWTAADLQTP